MNRKQMLAASLGAVAAGSAPAALAQSPAPPSVINRDSATLVLAGGGARGAFEAGAIEGLRQRAGVSDGERLPNVDAIAGTSIGAINGWFVATAQYTLLRRLWETIPSENIFQIKKQYAATVQPSSGVLTRIFQAALISQGLTSNVTGLLDGKRVYDWLARNVDPTVPLKTAFVFTVTNLNAGRAEVFYRPLREVTPEARAAAEARLRSIFHRSVTTREIEDVHLAAALQGSSAIPILLDPVTIGFADGPQTYIDGGVADSAPLDLARALSTRVLVVFVDPEHGPPQHFPNAAAVGTAAFGIAQKRIFEASLRAAYLETRGKRLFRLTATTPEQKAYLDLAFDVDLFVMRPQVELPVEVAGFDDAEGIQKTYELGRQAGLEGFLAYDPADALE